MPSRRQTLISLLVLWTMGITILRALRKPNDFSEVHWLLSYQFGFVKRGLIGEALSRICDWFSAPISERMILVLASIAFTVFCLAILGLSLRILRRFNWSLEATLAVLVFVSSPYVVMSSHLVGYFDNLIFLLVVGSIAAILAQRPWLGAGLQALSMFIHESTLLLSFPLYCLVYLLQLSQKRSAVSPVRFLLPVAFPVLAFLVVSLGHAWNMSPQFKEELIAHLSAHEYIQDQCNTITPQRLTKSLGAYLADEIQYLGGRLGSTRYNGIALPSVLAMLCFSASFFRIRLISLETLVWLAACFAPLLMHIVAYDTSRIWTYAIVNCFLALWGYSELIPPDASGPRGTAAGPTGGRLDEAGRLPGSASEVSSSIGLICLLVFLVNIVTMTPLMDMLEERFNLKMRMILYAPSIFGLGVLLLAECGSSPRGKLTIQGRDVFELLLPTQKN